MKPKPYEAQNTKFSEYQRSLLISYATFELLKFESRTDVIIEISRFLRHRRPGINEGVFGWVHEAEYVCLCTEFHTFFFPGKRPPKLQPTSEFFRINLSIRMVAVVLVLYDCSLCKRRKVFYRLISN